MSNQNLHVLEKTLFKQCIIIFLIKQPNFLVFTWCGEFHFSFATLVPTFKKHAAHLCRSVYTRRGISRKNQSG
jgi:hypothetical protein